MRDAIVILFVMCVLLSVLFVVEGKFSKLFFTLITSVAAIYQIISGTDSYMGFPAKAADAIVDYSPPVEVWLQRYNSFVFAALAVALLFFVLHFILVLLEREKIIKYSVYLTAALAVVLSLVIAAGAIAVGLANMNKYFDFASQVLAIAVSISSVIILYTVTYIKWQQEKL